MSTKNYSVSKNTATLLAAVEELVKANNSIGDALLAVYGNNESVYSSFDEAMNTAREELLKLVASEIEIKMLETREEVTEI